MPHLLPVRSAILIPVFLSLLPCGEPLAASGAPVRPPKLIFILSDDQGYGDFSCHDNPVLKTPHLDRLHAESARFTDFHVSPVCSPTRAALVTYPGKSHGFFRLHHDPRDYADTMARTGAFLAELGLLRTTGSPSAK